MQVTESAGVNPGADTTELKTSRPALHPTPALWRLLVWLVATLGFYKYRYYYQLHKNLVVLNGGSGLGRMVWLSFIPFAEWALLMRAFSALDGLTLQRSAAATDESFDTDWENPRGGSRKQGGLIISVHLVALLVARITAQDYLLLWLLIHSFPVVALHVFVARVMRPRESEYSLRRISKWLRIVIQGFAFPLMLAFCGMDIYLATVGRALERGEVIVGSQQLVSLTIPTEDWRLVEPGYHDSESPGVVELVGPESSWATVHRYDARAVPFEDVCAARRALIATQLLGQIAVEDHRSLRNPGPNWVAQSKATYKSDNALDSTFQVVTLQRSDDIIEVIATGEDAETLVSSLRFSGGVGQ